MTFSPVKAIDRNGSYQTVTRRLRETYVNGRPVRDAAPQPLSIFMSIQPTTGRELRALPEASHGEEVKVARSYQELKTRDGTYEPDEIALGGEIWVVVRVEAWPRHWCSYLMRRAAT